MNKKNITLEKIEGIYDIQPPLSPELSLFESSLIVLGVVILLSAAFYISWNLIYSNKGKCRRKIIRLQKKHLDNNVSSHDTIYQLCFLLRKGLKINYLGQNTQLPKKIIFHENQWQGFIKNISDSRYRNKESSLNIDKLFKESLFWLRIWP